MVGKSIETESNFVMSIKWGKVFKSGPSKIWGIQPSKVWSDVWSVLTDCITLNFLKAVFFTWSILEHFVRDIILQKFCRASKDRREVSARERSEQDVTRFNIRLKQGKEYQKNGKKIVNIWTLTSVSHTRNFDRWTEVEKLRWSSGTTINKKKSQ